MDGIDILKTVKRRNPDIPVVIISGRWQYLKLPWQTIKQGAYDFIEKTFLSTSLMVVVSSGDGDGPPASAENADLPETRRRRQARPKCRGSSAAFKTLKGHAAEEGDKNQLRVLLAGPSGNRRKRDGSALCSRQFAPYQRPRRLTVSSATLSPGAHGRSAVSAAKPRGAGWNRAQWKGRMVAWSISG
ncbi:MAG: hypothetical protein U5N55_10915 [Cypionkella sp.]|nr:hypothetical protein [Cypionkella sp.]